MIEHALAGPAAAAAAATPEHTTATRAAATRHDEPATGLMARVIDARLGTREVYTTTGHRTVTDRALAASLARLGR